MPNPLKELFDLLNSFFNPCIKIEKHSVDNVLEKEHETVEEIYTYDPNEPVQAESIISSPKVTDHVPRFLERSIKFINDLNKMQEKFQLAPVEEQFDNICINPKQSTYENLKSHIDNCSFINDNVFILSFPILDSSTKDFVAENVDHLIDELPLKFHTYVEDVNEDQQINSITKFIKEDCIELGLILPGYLATTIERLNDTTLLDYVFIEN